MKRDIIYDAEKKESIVKTDKEVIYDADKEISEKKKLILHDGNEDNTDQQSSISMIDENQPNVFTNGLNDGKFLLEHRCPMCMMTKKSITELFTRKKFSRKKKIVGYMSICANCGHVSFYTNDGVSLLKYFRGIVS